MVGRPFRSLADLELSAVILAGGKSRRMGQDKALLRRDGMSLLQRTIETLRPLTPDIVVAGREPIPELAVAARFVPDSTPDAGPLAGLQAGLAHARGSYVICVSCDMPQLGAAPLRLLVQRAQGFEAAVPLIGGKSQPLSAVYARIVEPRLGRFLAKGGRRAREFVDSLRVGWVREDELRAIDPELHSFLNVNTPEEWAAL